MLQALLKVKVVNKILKNVFEMQTWSDEIQSTFRDSTDVGSPSFGMSNVNYSVKLDVFVLFTLSITLSIC